MMIASPELQFKAEVLAQWIVREWRGERRDFLTVWGDETSVDEQALTEFNHDLIIEDGYTSALSVRLFLNSPN
jgi:hypothetical protein